MRKPCEGHTVSVVEKCLFVLFGKHEDDHGHSVCPPMQMLNTETMVLSSPSIEQDSRHPDAQLPDEREGHTATVVGRRIFIFGGTWTDEDDTTIYMNDLHVLDAGMFTWNRPNASGTPPIEREGHSAVAVGARIIIFGGTWVDDEDQSHYLNDLHVLHAENMAWSFGQCSGDAPIQREGHTASLVGLYMVVFGGAGLDADERPVNLNDVHLLETAQLAWSRPNVTGKVPQERRYHSASVVDQRLLIFGGQYYDASADLHFECDNAVCAFDLETLLWSSVAVDSAMPLRRACHAAGVVSKRVYLIGGRYWDVAEDDYIFLNDIQVLDTQPSSTRVADWQLYVNNPHLSDLTIIVRGVRVHAHRVVLAARCAYFRGMFESGMKEATQSEVAIDDISYEVFLALLEHLYTDRVEIASESALELFAAADFLGIEQLKMLCMARIEAELEARTVCHTLFVADKHSAAPLKDVCVSFIVEHFKEVHSTEGFHELSRNLLALVHAGVAARLDRGSQVAPANLN